MTSKIYKQYYKSPLGLIEIISNDYSITSVQFINKKSKNILTNKIINKCIKQLKEYFAGKRKYFTVPIILAGTTFQKRVWQTLLTIPYGSTCSYQDIAKTIGKPNAARAVGNANNKNKIAIIIPCHRVINKSKKIGGYAAGTKYKIWLINKEKINR